MLNLSTILNSYEILIKKKSKIKNIKEIKSSERRDLVVNIVEEHPST